MNAPVIRPYLAVLCSKGLESVPHSCADVTIRTLVPQPFGRQSSLGFGTYVHVSSDQEAERDRDYDCDAQNRASGQRSPRSAPMLVAAVRRTRIYPELGYPIARFCISRAQPG